MATLGRRTAAGYGRVDLLSISNNLGTGRLAFLDPRLQRAQRIPAHNKLPCPVPKSRRDIKPSELVEGPLVAADGFAVDASLIAADANKQRSIPSKDWKPEEIQENAVRAAQEYLATLDDAAFGAASPVTPKFISKSDPAAQWTGAHKGHAFFAYAANYLIDTDHGVIVDVEATRAIRQAEVGAARTMLERTETRFGIKPASLTADSAYGSADSLAWLVKEKDIAP